MTHVRIFGNSSCRNRAWNSIFLKIEDYTTYIQAKGHQPVVEITKKKLDTM
jgi:hypothetical protein